MMIYIKADMTLASLMLNKVLKAMALEAPKKDTKIILVDLIPLMIRKMSIFSLSQNVFRQDWWGYNLFYTCQKVSSCWWATVGVVYLAFYTHSTGYTALRIFTQTIICMGPQRNGNVRIFWEKPDEPNEDYPMHALNCLFRDISDQPFIIIVLINWLE